MNIIPRWMHRIWARFGGYFWLPCPVCNQYFGGHEVRDTNATLYSVPYNGSGRITCRHCIERTRQINERNFRLQNDPYVENVRESSYKH